MAAAAMHACTPIPTSKEKLQCNFPQRTFTSLNLRHVPLTIYWLGFCPIEIGWQTLTLRNMSSKWMVTRAAAATYGAGLDW
jgi:hypothetical protein